MVALVRGVHGLGGRLRVEVLTDHPDLRFAPGAVLHPEGTATRLTVVDARPVADGPGWWLVVREIGDREAAEALRGRYLEAVVGQDELPDGDVYWHEVVGVPVVGLDGAPLGSVADVYRVGVAEVLVVRGGPLGELDVPNVAAVVREFAPRDGRIVVDTAALDLEEAARPRRPRGRRTRRALKAAGSPPDAADGARPADVAGPADAASATTTDEGGTA